jgi:hypothetical protein
LTIAGGACPCVNELHGLGVDLIQTGSVGAPTWTLAGGDSLGWIYGVCTNRTPLTAPRYPTNYHTAYRMSVSCVTGGVLIDLEAYSAYEASEVGYACAPGSDTARTIPPAEIDPTAPVFTLTGMVLQPYYIAGITPCPCAGRVLTFTVTH